MLTSHNLIVASDLALLALLKGSHTSGILATKASLNVLLPLAICKSKLNPTFLEVTRSGATEPDLMS